MNELPLGVIAVYAAFAAWAGLAVRAAWTRSWTAPLAFGIGLALFLNLRYLVEGAAGGIAFFVSLYDVLDNLGLAAGEGAPALAGCPDNSCSLWGERYLQHSSWGVAFYDRFANGPALRSNLLYTHLVFNSIVFVLMHIQLARPATPGRPAWHRLLGRIAFVCLTIGTVCAVWLAAEHDPVSAYGGALSKWGFWSMSACVYGCAVLGVAAIRRGDSAAHRVWMYRFVGSMWGAFWLFRAMLVVSGPLLREWETVSILLSIWLSAPLGAALGDWVRRRLDARAPGHGAAEIHAALGARG